MADPFVAEIRIFAGNFPPYGWAFCNGQLLPISQNTALFSLLGTTYGGDGKSTFGLPNLQGAAPMQAGQGPGLSLRDLGETGGEAAVTLLESTIPAHSHGGNATSNGGSQLSPAGSVPATPGFSRGATAYTTGAATGTLNASALHLTGGSQPHNNMPPFLTLTFIIALQGVYPVRS
jgi:microcystin-dependent protein